MLNDGVPPAPGSRKLFGASAESQRLLINFEPVMGEHSVAVLHTRRSFRQSFRQRKAKGLREMSKLQCADSPVRALEIGSGRGMFFLISRPGFMNGPGVKRGFHRLGLLTVALL